MSETNTKKTNLSVNEMMEAQNESHDRVVTNLIKEAASTSKQHTHIPNIAANAVLGESETMPDGTPIVKGHDFESQNETNTLPQFSTA